jgi:muconolactone delta-isomerase
VLDEVLAEEEIEAEHRQVREEEEQRKSRLQKRGLLSWIWRAGSTF